MRTLLALIVACALAQADTVFLKDGSKVEGKVVGVANGKVGVKTTEGKMVWLEEAAVERIEKDAPETPPETVPPTDPSTGGDPAAAPPEDPTKQPPKGPLTGPKCPNCKGKKTVKCTTCTDGIADLPCPECSGQGFINCPTCNGRATLPCSCEGKNPKCPKCNGIGAGDDCPNCASGALNCERCQGQRTISGPCPDCKKKKKVACPACQGTGVDPNAANPDAPPADPGDPAADPPEDVVEDPGAEEPSPEDPPKAPEEAKRPAAELSSPSVETVFGVVEGIARTEGKKLWKVSAKLTNGEELGSLVVKCGDFTLRTDDGTEVKALVPQAGHPDAAPKMIGKSGSKDIRLWFETAYDRTPKTLLFTTPKWTGEPFSVDLPKAK